MPADNIDTLTTAHERRLADEMEAALAAYLATIDADQLASAIDDVDADHIRSQLAIVLELDERGEPQALADALDPSAFALASFISAVAALAAAQARHTLNPGNADLRAAQDAAPAFVRRYLADTAQAIGAAIETAIYGPGTPQARARQLKRSIGLTVRQTASLDVMRAALQRYLDSPQRRTTARTDANGVRIPATITRRANPRDILAGTRGRISAAQRQILAKALNTPKLSQAEADAILDSHAAAMRRMRTRAVASEGVHQLAEAAKLTGWRIAQRFGALPQYQRRHWRTAGDERVRHTHAHVPGMNPGGVPLDQPFKTPFGPRMNAPLEWGCRCKAVLGVPR